MPAFPTAYEGNRPRPPRKQKQVLRAFFTTCKLALLLSHNHPSWLWRGAFVINQPSVDTIAITGAQAVQQLTIEKVSLGSCVLRTSPRANARERRSTSAWIAPRQPISTSFIILRIKTGKSDRMDAGMILPASQLLTTRTRPLHSGWSGRAGWLSVIFSRRYVLIRIVELVRHVDRALA